MKECAKVKKTNMKRYQYKPKISRPGRHAKHKKYGQLHESGLNRAQRRADAHDLRRAPQLAIKKAVEDLYDKQKFDRAKRIRKQQEAAHLCALARKQKLIEV